jgi:hypothetical protein
MAGTPPTPLTYGELYSDPTKNPFGIDDDNKEVCYSGMYQVWRATSAPMTTAILHRNVLADFSRPIGGIGIFVADDDSPTGILKFLHRVESFPGTPGHSRDRMVSLCYEGDVSGCDICTVGFDENQLALTPDVIIPGSYERTLQLLREEPTSETLGPFLATHANITTTKTRGMCYFPFEMMESLLGTNLTARQVFELIVPVLVDAGLETACSSLITFLTIALVQPSSERQESWTLQPQAGLAGYVPGPMAMSYRREHVLYRDLPALRPGSVLPAVSDPALVDVARGMRDMVVEARAERRDRLDHREKDRRARTIREKLGDAITDRLLLLCQAPADEELPPVYHQWAARTRGVSERYVLQQAVGASCAVQNVPVFDVTPTQVMTFKKI